jgi:hypothetical protein
LTVRLFSNPASVRRGELSALAIAETIAATGLSFWLAWRLGSIQHIVQASAVAPLLLLRTPLSTWYAIRVYKEIGRLLLATRVVRSAKEVDFFLPLTPAPFVATVAATSRIVVL